MRLMVSAALMLGVAAGATRAQPMPAAAAPTGDLHRRYLFAATGAQMPYRLYVPASYRPDRPMPLVLVLHGGGGDENAPLERSDIRRVAERRGYMLLSVLGNTPYGSFGNIYPVVVGKGPAAASAGFRAASISGGRSAGAPPPADAHGPAPVDDYVEQQASELTDPRATMLSEQETLAALAEVRKAYAVDPARIYLMGNSMGGVGTLYLGAKYPELWAAISPSDGPIAAWSYPYARLAHAHVPALFVHGALDEKSNPHWTELLADNARRDGVESRMLLVPGGTHGSAWTMALDPIFDFFDAHRRSAPAP